MKLFERYTQRLYGINNKEDAPPVPEKGLPLFWYLLRTHFSRLIMLNMLHVLFCLPVVTIPAATAASARVCMKLVRDGYCLFWQEYWEEFKSQFFSRLALWLLLTLLPIAFALWMRILGTNSLFSVILIALSTLMFLLQSYLFPLISMIDLPLLRNLENSLMLMVLEWKTTLLILATTGIIYMLCIFFFPLSLPVILLIALSLGQLINCMLINPVMNKRLVKPEDGPTNP